MLAGAGVVVASHFAGLLRWKLGCWGVLPKRPPPRVDLSAWTPPDTRAARDAEAFLREVSSLEMVGHCMRSYCFAAALYELSPVKPPIDREALYVGAVLHDVGLCKDLALPGDRCFTVSCAREARRIAKDAGWDDARQDRMALVITSNLNSSVSIEEFGAEAHFMRVGGMVEVLAQDWKVHPKDLSNLLARHPRRGFADDVLPHIAREVARNPGCRFASLSPLLPWLVRRSKFSVE